MKTSGVLAAFVTLFHLTTALPTGSSTPETGVSAAIQLLYPI
jgi:hypothetical protein